MRSPGFLFTGITLITLPSPLVLAAPSWNLPAEVVKAAPINSEDGKLWRAFHPQKAPIGVLGQQRLMDTAYSVNVLDRPLLTNLDVHDTADALKYFPSTQMEFRDGNGTGRPQSRGFEGGVIENMHEDGFNIVATTPVPIEMYDHLDVINGLTGPQYGAANPAGNFDYATKRPTRDYENTYGTAVTSHGRIMNSLDLSGTPSRYVGYRVNLLHDEGKGWAQDSHLNRTLGSLDLDLHPASDTTIQLHDSVYRWKGHGFPGGLQGYTEYGLPAAMDARKRGYGQKYAGSDMRTNTQSFKLIQNMDDNWKLTAGVLHQNAFRQTHNVTNVMTSPTTYEQRYTRINSTAWKFDVVSNLFTLNGHVKSGPVTHHLTAATNGFHWSTYNGNATNYSGDTNTVLGEASLDHPRTFEKPDTPTLPHYKSSSVSQQNLMIGDSLDFGRHYTLDMNVARQFFHSASWNAKGTRTGKGSDQGNSATIAFLYKPSDAITTYVAYATSLQIGGMAPQGAKNAYQLLSPIRSHQLEAGIKTHVGGMDINGALFRITRPLAYTGDNGVYGVQGKQRNNGAEFWANGNLTDRLRVMGGVTWIDATLEDAVDQASANKRVVGVPRYQANLLAEYELPTLPDITLTSNIHFTGKRAADPTNQSWASGYTTLDAGVRYVNPDIHGHRLKVALMVDNLTNRQYWAGIFPSSIYGDTGANYTAFLGQPRTATLSAAVSF